MVMIFLKVTTDCGSNHAPKGKSRSVIRPGKRAASTEQLLLLISLTTHLFHDASLDPIRWPLDPQAPLPGRVTRYDIGGWSGGLRCVTENGVLRISARGST